MTLVKLEETIPSKAYMEQLRATAEKLQEYERKECAEADNTDDFDAFYDKYLILFDELELSYDDLENAISKIFEMCDTLTEVREVMQHMKVARELRFIWYPIPRETLK